VRSSSDGLRVCSSIMSGWYDSLCLVLVWCCLAAAAPQHYHGAVHNSTMHCQPCHEHYCLRRGCEGRGCHVSDDTPDACVRHARCICDNASLHACDQCLGTCLLGIPYKCVTRRSKCSECLHSTTHEVWWDCTCLGQVQWCPQVTLLQCSYARIVYCWLLNSSSRG
jgi:hypothetical protein